MQNFHTDTDLFEPGHIILKGDEYFHATRSCRVKIGEEIGVTDGLGRRVIAQIDTIENGQLSATIIQDISGQGEPLVNMTLAMSVIKAARFETAVEKCTEIGVRRILPVITDRMESHADRRLNKTRLERIAQAAAKQAARSWVPEVSKPVKFSDLISTPDGTIFVASQHTSQSIVESISKCHDIDKVTCFIGPEGDFTESEFELMDTHGVIPFSLGGLTLRAETAAIAATLLIVDTIRKQSV